MKKLNRRQIRQMLISELRNIRLNESMQPNEAQKALQDMLGSKMNEFMMGVGSCVMMSMGQKDPMECAMEQAEKMFRNEDLKELKELLEKMGSLPQY